MYNLKFEVFAKKFLSYLDYINVSVTKPHFLFDSPGGGGAATLDNPVFQTTRRAVTI